jgi:hypothetical protein
MVKMLRGLWQALVILVMNFVVPQMAGNVLTSHIIIRFLKRILSQSYNLKYGESPQTQ